MSNNVHSSVRHSFIFPVYNEASYLSPQLKLFYQLLEKNYFTQFEVLLIENGSTDQTWATMQRLAKKYPGLRNLRISQASYGQALKHGILSALGQKIYVLNIDFFNSNFISQAKKLLDKYEIVVGSKTLRESQDHRGLLRQIQTKIFHQSLKMLFSYPGTDTHGLKAFRSTPALIKTLRACSVKHELLDTELVLKLCQQKQSLQEVPVVVRELRPTRYTSWRRVRLTLIDLWRIITFKLGGYLSNNSNNQLQSMYQHLVVPYLDMNPQTEQRNATGATSRARYCFVAKLRDKDANGFTMRFSKDPTMNAPFAVAESGVWQYVANAYYTIGLLASNFIVGKTVFRRNPIIADLLSRIHFGEKIGTGFGRIKEICRKSG